MTVIPDDDDNDDSDESDEDEIPEDMQVSVVVRDINDNQREARLVLGDTEIEMAPGSNQPSIRVNRREIQLSEHSVYRNGKNGDNDFEAHLLPGGHAAVIRSEEYGIIAVYDGERIKLILANQYRDQVRGLCGTFTGEPATDFTSPKNCVLKNPEEFTGSYALTKQQCQGPAQENQRKAAQAHCFRETVLFGDVVNDQEAGRPKSKSSSFGHQKNQGSSRSEGSSRGGKGSSPTKYQTIVMEEGDQICFSLRPVPACASGHKPTQQQQKTVAMHCVPNSSHAQAMAQRIKKGANPDFSQKASSKSARISVPERCVPKNK